MEQSLVLRNLKIDSAKLCRLCLSKEVKLTKTFLNDSGTDDSLLRKIYECTTVKITLKSKYPTSICAICDARLNEYSRFREKCIENDEILRKVLDAKVGVVEISTEDETQTEDEAAMDDDLSVETTEPRVDDQLEYQESSEIRDLQLQLYGSSDETTLSQSEFAGMEEPTNSASKAALTTPLPIITNVTSDAIAKALESTRKEPVSTPAAEEPSPVVVKPTIKVKPLSSLAASTAVSPEPTAAEPSPMASSESIEADKMVPSNFTADGRLECTVCARPFRNAYTLRRHMNLHTEQNLYTCEYCSKKFNDRSNWKIHLRAHTGDNLLRCAVCFKTFISPSTLKYHLRAHRKLKVFECKLCDESRITYEALSDHVSEKHGDVRLEDLSKNSEDSLMAGDFLKIEMEADETTLSAAGLGETMDDSSTPIPVAPPPLLPAVSLANELSGEIKIKEELPDPDVIEIKQEPVEDDMLEPVPSNRLRQQLTALIPAAEEDASPVILFRCDYCMKIFKFLYELRVHMKIHNKDTSSAETPSAEPAASKPATLVLPAVEPPPAKKPRHPSIDADVGELANAPLPEHACNKCEKSFRTEDLLKVHQETHKTDDDITQARSCKVCFKTFKCELNLLSHTKKHHPYESFVTEQQANIEDRMHAEDKPQSPDSSSNDGNQSQGESSAAAATEGSTTVERKCEICALTFDCSYKLEKHVLSHFKNNEAVAFVPSADRPYKCKECHKRFKRKDYLLIHIRTHTGERRHKCDMCSSAFVHPSNLITHRKLHSNERPFKCDLCSAAFKLYAGLKIHRKRCALKYLQENSVSVT